MHLNPWVVLILPGLALAADPVKGKALFEDNCSMCHKCERAMVAIAAYGRAEDFTVFDRTVSLADRLDALPPLPLMHRVLRHAWWLRRRRP